MPTRLNSTRLVSMMDLFVFHLPFVSVCLSVCQQSVCVQVYECASACVSACKFEWVCTWVCVHVGVCASPLKVTSVVYVGLSVDVCKLY